MLEPHDRRLLLEALRPASGYLLDRAIGTTFSLDLLTLLTVPLAFTIFDWQDGDGRPTSDPLMLLDALRRHSDRISIFCQSGQIAVPAVHQTLFGYLENSIFEVNAPNPRGVFHPKVWVLRYEPSEEGGNGPVLYRLLVLSRNLTFDRSWDVMLRLDGELSQRRNAFARNHPLGEFIDALPGLAQRPIPELLKSSLDRIQHEIRRVEFELPEGFEELKFWPIGLRRGQTWPFAGRIDRLLVISPFLTPSLLQRLTREGREHLLVSLPESLADLDPETRSRFAGLKVLADAANPESSDQNDVDPNPVHEVAPVRGTADSFPLTGLHAKIYVADAGWNARTWIGSANATEMAFNGNVEFLVETTAKKSRCGIGAILDHGDQTISLADLLQDYQPTERVLPSQDDHELERILDNTRRSLARANLFARVEQLETTDQYRMALLQPGDMPIRLSEGLRAWIRPVTLQEGTATEIRPMETPQDENSMLAQFGPVSFEALTSFFVVRLEARVRRRTATTGFVLNLPLLGAPEDRRERLLRTILRNRDQVLRYLLLLLAEGGLESGQILADLARTLNGQMGKTQRTLSFPLFEALIRALYRDPSRIDEIQSLVENLRQDDEGMSLLPEGFTTIWDPIWSARERVV